MMQTTSSHTLPENFEAEFSSGFTARYVRGKARQLRGLTSLGEADRFDLEQEMLMEVWTAAPTFDPETGDWPSFVATIVERKAAHILIHRRAEKRATEQDLTSLDIPIKDSDGIVVPLGTQMLPEHQNALTGVGERDLFEQIDGKLDLEKILESLPPEDVQLLRELTEKSQAKVAAARGISRRTLRGRLEQIRERCQKRWKDSAYV